METLVRFVVEWWRLELGIMGAVVVFGVLWRWALADLVLSSVELP